MSKESITTIPYTRKVYYATYANLPATGLKVGDLGYATDRLVFYRWSGAAWQAVTIHSSAGTFANRPNAADLPDGSLYYETDTLKLDQVQTSAWVEITKLTWDAGDIVSGILADARIPELATSKITSGRFPLSRLGWTANKILKGAGVGSDPTEIDVPSPLTVAETEVFTGVSPDTWTDLDLSGTIGANLALVLLKINRAGGDQAAIAVRKNGDTDEFWSLTADELAMGCALFHHTADIYGVLLVATDANGIIEWKAEKTSGTTTIDVIAYIK